MRERCVAQRLFGAMLAACALLSAVGGRAQESTNAEPARLKISGYGLLGDLKLKRMLKILNEGTNPPALFQANFVEDAALLLLSRLRDDGFLKPAITAQLTLQDGSEVTYAWDESVEEPLPRPLGVRRVEFRIKEGVRYHLDLLEFEGLHALPEKQARAFFVETAGLLRLKGNRVYTPDKLKRGMANLTDSLQRSGYQNATVVARRVETDDRKGSVRVYLTVKEGPQFIVRSVRQEIYFGNDPQPEEVRTNSIGKPFSRLWQQDFEQSVKTNYYRRGYPDTAIEFQTERREPTEGRVLLDLRALVKTGPRIRVGDVVFTGNKRTREEVLERRATLKEGDWLDRVKAERTRYRLSRLGIFDSVTLKYEAGTNDTRNVIYEVDEGKRQELSLLFGYGSYELLRAGIQLDQNNLFGRAHHARLRLTQSFKSSSADYTYTMPELLGENVDVFFNANGLRREEVSFTRLEYGGGVGARKFFRGVDTDLSVRYNYEVLHATQTETNFADVGVQNPGVGALITDVRHDRRDNPLYPRRGYKIFSNIEFASQYLAGDVNYQRLDISGSYHWPLSDSQWLHFGLSHGVASTIGNTAQNLPFNRRFFPGGENSIRGYQEGQAAPRNAEGKIVGAETYLLGNLEFEQGLTPRWSLVFFGDAVGFAQQLKEYPMNEELYSVGGGLTWKTFIGPVRLEYGYNLNPRPRDPSGTLHFSLGFPF